MKKAVLLLTCALVMAVITAGNVEQKREPVVMKCYIDNDKNGICDRFERKSCKAGDGTGAKDCIKPKQQ